MKLAEMSDRPSRTAGANDGQEREQNHQRSESHTTSALGLQAACGCKLSTRQFSEEFLLVKPVLEGFTAIDENHRNFVGKLPTELVIRLDVYFAPVEPAPAFEFREGLLHDLTQMTTSAGIDDDFAQEGHLAGV
jgi:hypothetical protein